MYTHIKPPIGSLGARVFEAQHCICCTGTVSAALALYLLHRRCALLHNKNKNRGVEVKTKTGAKLDEPMWSRIFQKVLSCRWKELVLESWRNPEESWRNPGGILRNPGGILKEPWRNPGGILEES